MHNETPSSRCASTTKMVRHASCRFELHKRRQVFIGTDNEALTVVAMSVIPAGFEIPVLRSCAESGINLLLMKRLLLFFIISAAFPYTLFASDSLPFPVSLGGQAAKDGTPFAKIENPVAADAELAVESKSDMIIVNVNMVNAKNEPIPGSTPAVILLQGKTKTNIDKTMDGKKLPAGNYIMSVVSEGKTASILVTIK